jgi:repressor LexA
LCRVFYRGNLSFRERIIDKVVRPFSKVNDSDKILDTIFRPNIIAIMGRKRLLAKETVLSAINQWLVQYGVAPTIEELRKALKVGSTRTVLRYLDQLEEDELIERRSGARGLRPLKSSVSKGFQTQAVPLIGQVAAGPFMLAEENLEGWVRLPKTFTKPPSAKFFLLRVKGDSMNKAQVDGGKIEEGDLVLVRQESAGSDGQIVVALVDDAANIKRFAKGPGYYLLKPESTNPKHHPIVLNKDFRIQGVVIRVLKNGSELLSLEEF